MATLQKTVVQAEVGPLQRKTGVLYVHEVALDGDENLKVGTRVEIVDGGDEHHDAQVIEIETTAGGHVYKIALRG